MAAIRSYGGNLVVTSGNSIAVTNIRTPDVWNTVNLPSVACDHQEKKDDGDDAQGARTGDGTTAAANRALASGFSRSGRYFAVCDDRKMLHLYRTDTLPMVCLSSRMLARRATSLTFTLDEATVVVADKSGDVYSFPCLAEVKDDDNGEAKIQGRLLLGHLSMVLDVVLAEDDRYVVTSDRDEKMRVSHYPNAYSVHTYCLGHTQFVSCMTYVEEFRVLISGSGDCSLRMWDMEGKQLCKVECPVKQTTAAVTARHQSTGMTEGEESVQEGKGDEKNGDKEDDTDREAAEDQTTRTAIQKLTYCKDCRLLVVSFYNLGELQVYQLEVNKDGEMALTLVQTLPMGKDPWDVSYDESVGTLWALRQETDKPLAAYTVRTSDSGQTGQHHQLCEVPADSEDTVSQVVNTANSHGHFFADSMDVASPIPSLWKTCRQDNVLDYKQRKEQRLQGQQKDDSRSQHHHHHHNRGKKNKKRLKLQDSGDRAAAGSQECEKQSNKKPRPSS